MSQDRNLPVVPPSTYEPPRVETVLSDQQLEREVQYGGATQPTVVSPPRRPKEESAMEQGRETAVKPPSEYEPPRIEAELTDKQLAREVHTLATH